VASWWRRGSAVVATSFLIITLTLLTTSISVLQATSNKASVENLEI
jgi:hypothetical protein